MTISLAFAIISSLHSQAQEPLSLGQAVNEAFGARSSIRAQVEKVKAAQASHRAAAVEPPIRLETGYGTRPELGIGNDLLLAIPVDLFGKNAAERSVAYAEILNAQAELVQTAVELQSEVFNAYSELLAAQEELESAQALAALNQQSYDATKKRIDSGDLPPSQLLRSDLELRRSNQAVESDQLNLASARATFGAVIGIAPETVPPVEDTTFVLPTLGKIEGRPDVAVAKAAVATATAQKNAAKSSIAPDFELQLAHDYWDVSGHYTARVQLVWNLFDYGAGANRQSAVGHTTKSAELTLKDLLAQARAQVVASKSAYEAALKDFQGYRSLASDSKTLLEKEQRAFALGGSTLLDVLDASRSYRDVLDQQTQARARLISAEGKLLSATGTLIGTFPEVKKS